MTRLPRPDAVLFDWDSTLVDNWGGITRALSTTFTEYGLDPWDEVQVRANAKLSMRDSFPKLFGERWEDASKKFYESFASIHLETLRPLPGAVELLDALAAEAIPMGIVSNKSGIYLRLETGHLGWDRYFHRILGSHDAPKDKPAADPIHMALEGTGVAAGPSVWFVGDSAVDLAAAHAARCVPVLLHPEDPHPEDLTDCAPAVHLFDCYALLGELRG